MAQEESPFVFDCCIVSVCTQTKNTMNLKIPSKFYTHMSRIQWVDCYRKREGIQRQINQIYKNGSHKLRVIIDDI